MMVPQPPAGTPAPKYAVRHTSPYDGAICETMPLSLDKAIENAREKRKFATTKDAYVVAITSRGQRVRVGAIK